MKLTPKLLLAVVLAFLASAALNALILKATVAPAFAELEHRQALADVRRVQEAIRREGDQLVATAQDWAFWDDTYRFAIGQNEAFVADNLYPQTLQGLSIDLLYVLDRQGKVLWHLILEPKPEMRVRAAALPDDRFPADHPILRLRPDDEAHHGIVASETGLVVISAAPILTNEREGPPAGTLIVGRILTPAMIAGLKAQTRVDFRLLPLEGEKLTPKDHQAFRELTPAAPVALDPTSETVLTVRALLNGLQGDPVALIRASIPRDVVGAGREAQETTMALLALEGGMVLLALVAFTRSLFVAPLKALTRSVAAFGRTGTPTKLKIRNRRDEIGALTREFGVMAEQLAVTRERLLAQSYFSGRVDATAGALHNLRNLLSPINMTLWHIKFALQENTSAEAFDAMARLQDPQPPRESRRLLWQRIERFVRASDERDVQILSDLQEVIDQHDRIEDILVSYDPFLQDRLPLEDVSLAEAIDQASRVIPAPERRSIAIVRPRSLPSIRAQRVLLVQVLGNIIANAAESIAAADPKHAEISISCRQEIANGRPVVRLAIADNGEGIAEERLPRIFERGYSSRPHKKGGLGLYWCANTLAGMGGRLAARSDGPGNGAVMVLTLPLAEDRGAKAAE